MISENSSKVVGIDIGGSHITAAVVDLENRSILPGTLIRKRVNAHDAADIILDEWAETIQCVFDSGNEISKKIGLAMPGPFDYEKGTCLIKGLDKFETLYGINIKQLLAQKLEIQETDIRMMNDASCFLQGEIFGGAGRGCNHVIGITLGTGLGSARFHNDIMYDGDLYFAPFKDGTAEDYLSSRWFVKKYEALSGNIIKDVKELKDNIAVDAFAQTIFDEFGNNLGEVLTNYIRKHPCETVVIGGNIINAWELFFHETERILHLLPKPVTIKKAQLGEEGALIGAASLWR